MADIPASLDLLAAGTSTGEGVFQELALDDGHEFSVSGRVGGTVVPRPVFSSFATEGTIWSVCVGHTPRVSRSVLSVDARPAFCVSLPTLVSRTLEGMTGPRTRPLSPHGRR